MKKAKIIGFVLLIFILILTGCSKSSQSENDNGLEKVSIMLDWYPNAVHTAIYVAKEKGYFKEQGLDVDIKMPADTNDPLKLAAVGKVDLAISYQQQLLQSRAEGIPVVSVAALVRHPLDAVMFKEESGITSPKDFAGKNIGYASSTLSEATIQAMMKHDKADASKVKMTDVGWDLIPSLATDQVDAIVGGYMNHEYVLLKNEGYQMEALPLTEYGIPDYYELVLITGEKTIKTKKSSIEKFWSAVTKGQQDVNKQPEESLQVLLDHENDSFPLDQKVEKESLAVLQPLMLEADKPFGYQDRQVWQESADWLYKMKVIQKKVDVSKAYLNIVTE